VVVTDRLDGGRFVHVREYRGRLDARPGALGPREGLRERAEAPLDGLPHGSTERLTLAGCRAVSMHVWLREYRVGSARGLRGQVNEGGVTMATAVIGIGNIGGTLARHLVRGGEPVVLAAKDESNAAALAQDLGDRARAASVEEAIAEADAVVFAVWLDTIKELTATDAGLLENKVVVDPSNPPGFDEGGQMIRTLPEGQSAGS